MSEVDRDQWSAMTVRVATGVKNRAAKTDGVPYTAARLWSSPPRPRLRFLGPVDLVEWGWVRRPSPVWPAGQMRLKDGLAELVGDNALLT